MDHEDEHREIENRELVGPDDPLLDRALRTLLHATVGGRFHVGIVVAPAFGANGPAHTIWRGPGGTQPQPAFSHIFEAIRQGPSYTRGAPEPGSEQFPPLPTDQGDDAFKDAFLMEWTKARACPQPGYQRLRQLIDQAKEHLGANRAWALQVIAIGHELDLRREP